MEEKNDEVNYFCTGLVSQAYVIKVSQKRSPFLINDEV